MISLLETMLAGFVSLMVFATVFMFLGVLHETLTGSYTKAVLFCAYAFSVVYVVGCLTNIILSLF